MTIQFHGIRPHFSRMSRTDEWSPGANLPGFRAGLQRIRLMCAVRRTGKIAGVNAIVITVSDSCYAGRRRDLSGPAVAAALTASGLAVDALVTVPDEIDPIAQALRLNAARASLLVTTGGTGIARRDVTPEATRSVCERILDGFAERMRAEGLKKTPLAPLSRAVCGTLGSTLILNVPGSPQGAVQSLEAVLGLIPHALALLAGHTEHSGTPADGRAE